MSIFTRMSAGMSREVSLETGAVFADYRQASFGAKEASETGADV